ncbi:type I-E CRISPR-associated protein Cas5/CasD [Magnetofaba australis]|nr:type I-E CRISPR-associated protein Cas5/CasD [Magnetofaba australis]
MEILLMRLEGPLMSFGGARVDHHNHTERFPGVSLLTGLFGNALGLRHDQPEALQALQSRLLYAARLDRPGEELRDYQTVDLGQPHLCQPGWTTQHRVEKRGSGEATRGTHIRYRFYRAETSVTVAVRLTDDDAPTVADLAAALARPARPLFLGRKGCPPSAPLLIGVKQADSLHAALCAEPLAEHAEAGPYAALWPDRQGEPPGEFTELLADTRDWRNNVHTGRRSMRRGEIEVKPLV